MSLSELNSELNSSTFCIVLVQFGGWAFSSLEVVPFIKSRHIACVLQARGESHHWIITVQ